MADITQILHRLTHGDSDALAELTPLVYQHLRELAQRQLSQRDARRWDATELVHEAYLRLIGDVAIGWKDRTHFYAVAATVIRRVLVDQVRKINSQKRGGQFERADLDVEFLADQDGRLDLIELDEALERLAELCDRQAKLVELRFFGGLTQDEAAEYLGVSRRTVAGDWAMARAWLYRELTD